MTQERHCARSYPEAGMQPSPQLTMKTTNQTDQSIFSEQWDIYKRVIDYNYMCHAELIEVIKGRVNNFKAPSILDLGCGDSYVISQSLSSGQVIDYWGVDSAAMALDFGRSNLEGTQGEITLINEDLFEALEGMKRSFDVIISGYSLHHLQTEEKEKCFSLISNLMGNGGVFIFYDLERNSDETCSEYIGRACNIITNEWNEFDEEAIKNIRAHVEDQDLPENEAFYLENFERAGFSDVEKVFRDKDKIFSAYTARK